MNKQNMYLSQHSQSEHIYVVHSGIHHSTAPSCCAYYSCAYIAHGNGTLEYNNDINNVSENDVFLFHPNITYKFNPDIGLRRMDIYFCYFTDTIIEAFLSDFMEHFSTFSDFFDNKSSFIYSVDSDNKEIRDIFIRMIDEYMSSFPCSNSILHCYIPILVTKMLRNTKTRDFKRVYSQNRTIDEAIRYINQKMYTKISLQEISKHLNVSSSFVCRQFKKYTGMTTSQFINFLRVDKIKDILKNTDKPTDSIPEMFTCNVEYLKKVFKRETNMSMTEYRNKYHYKHTNSNKK